MNSARGSPCSSSQSAYTRRKPSSSGDSAIACRKASSVGMATSLAGRASGRQPDGATFFTLVTVGLTSRRSPYSSGYYSEEAENLATGCHAMSVDLTALFEEIRKGEQTLLLGGGNAAIKRQHEKG